MIATLPNLTDQQRQAIETRNCSISLSAGAGCGKTFVLTERFLSHLQPDDPDAPPEELHELIAITFTDRAAREMRDRIQKKCYERLQQAEGKNADYWLKLLRNLDTARISTIHSFCGALLRSHAVEAKLDPRFTVVEQTQADTLIAELIDDVLREKLSDQEPPLMDLTARFGLERLRAMIAALLAEGRTIDFETWLGRRAEDVITIWERYCRETVVPRVLQQVADAPATRQLLKDVCLLKNATGVLRGRCEILSRAIPALPHSKKPATDLQEIFDNARIIGTGKRDSWPDGELYDRFKEAAEKVRKLVTSALDFVGFDASAATSDAEAGLQVLRLVKAVLDRYETRKAELAWLDFNDLLVRARDLLVNPEHAELQKRLSQHVRLLLVDECQDTDPVQVDLIKALCGERFKEGKLFFVGDYKQSIYRFRGADPRLFRELQQETPTPGRLPLSVNFRSQPAILDFVNALFGDVPLAGQQAGLAYEPLQPMRPQVSPTPAVEFLWAMTEGRRQEAGAIEAARKREAEFIARRISGMLERGEQLVAVRDENDEWSTRAVQPGDIALLFRSLSDVQHYEDALRRYGIEYYLVGGHAFYAQQEIFDVLNLLRSLVSRADQISLVGVLRSPMFALDDETLYWLARHPQGLAAGLFADKLPAELTEAQRQRAQFAATTLGHLRDIKDEVPIVALLNEALALTGYDATLLGEFLGERKLANLRKLLEQARTFDRSGVMGLADFIVQLAEFVAKEPREALAATHPEDANVVRLMTIHQAKGLEFPVVFVVDIDRARRGEDETAVWQPELGPLVRLPASSEKEKHLTGLDLYRAVSSGEAEAERLRLLYVATTRAADYLVLSGGVFDLDEPAGPWSKLLGEHFDLKSGDCLATLAKGEDVPEVKVTSEAPPTSFTAISAERIDLEKEMQRAIDLSKQPQQPDNVQAALVARVPIDVGARRRFSVSRLSGELQAVDEIAQVYGFDEEEQSPPVSDAAELGTLVHRVLARLTPAGEVDVADLIRRVADASTPDGLEHSEAAEKMVRRFLESSRVKALGAARTVHPELEFLLRWPPQTSKETQKLLDDSGGGRYLQGFIDCLYQDGDGKWHLLDYKTNRVGKENMAAAAKQYEMQLGVYALAVENILGQPPVELVVHFLQPSAEHQFVWDEKMRQQTIDQVNQAIGLMVKESARGN